MSSKTLHKNISKFINDGQHFTDVSKDTDKTLDIVMKNNIIPFSKTLFKNVTHRKQISLYECQSHLNWQVNKDDKNKKVFMKPDGGILFSDNKPILISEMKVQGTNDTRHKSGLKRQATGNAIERAAKNIRGAEMLFDNVDFFPYVIFVSGCDFHPCETIAKRLEMMNYGIPNKVIIVEPNVDIDSQIKNQIDKIDINKKNHKCIATIMVKTHKWDQMPNTSSLWKEDEITIVLETILKKVDTLSQQRLLIDSLDSLNL